MEVVVWAKHVTWDHGGVPGLKGWKKKRNRECTKEEIEKESEEYRGELLSLSFL